MDGVYYNVPNHFLPVGSRIQLLLKTCSDGGYRQCVTKRLWQTQKTMPVIISKNNDWKNKFWFTPVSCRYQSSKCTGRSSDSSRLLRLPSMLPVAKNATNITPWWSRDTQQQELFRIRTGFPFHPSVSNVASRLLVHYKCMWCFWNAKTILGFFFYVWRLISMI